MRLRDDAGGEAGEVGPAAAVDGQILDGALVDGGGDGVVLSVQDRRLVGDLDLVGDGPGAQFGCQRGEATDGDVDRLFDIALEAVHGEAHGVGAGLERVDGELAVSIALDDAADAGVDGGDRDGSSGKERAAAIGDGATDGAGGGGLAQSRRRCERGQQTEERDEQEGLHQFRERTRRAEDEEHLSESPGQ